MGLLRFLLGVTLAAAVASGCLVGITTADPPAIPKSSPSKTQSRLPVYFRTCDPALPLPCASTPDGDRVKLSLWRVLVAEYGATVQEGDPPPGTPFIAYRFSITPPTKEQAEENGSMMVSLFTFSLIPGYHSRAYAIDVVAERSDPPAAPVSSTFHYDLTLRSYFWFPFIVAPDVIFLFVNGGENSRPLNRGMDEVVRRLAYDTSLMASGAPGEPRREPGRSDAR